MIDVAPILAFCQETVHLVCEQNCLTPPRRRNLRSHPSAFTFTDLAYLIDSYQKSLISLSDLVSRLPLGVDYSSLSDAEVDSMYKKLSFVTSGPKPIKLTAEEFALVDEDIKKWRREFRELVKEMQVYPPVRDT